MVLWPDRKLWAVIIKPFCVICVSISVNPSYFESDYAICASITLKVMQKPLETSISGQNLSLIFSPKSGCMYPVQLCCYEVKLLNLKLKTCLQQLLGSLLFRYGTPWRIWPRAQCYKTFYFSHLQIFIISWSVCLWQIFPASPNAYKKSQEPTQVKYF